MALLFPWVKRTSLASLLALSLGASLAHAQQRPDRRDFNPLRTTFTRAWDQPLTDPVKLIEIAPVRNDTQNNLIFLVGSRNRDDYTRQLRITHWNGGQFVTDYQTSFQGQAIDALLAGRFRVVKPAPVLNLAPPKNKIGQVEKPKDTDKAASNDPAPKDKADKKGKKSDPLPTRQIVTTEGVYAWGGSVWNRLFASPPSVTLGLLFPEGPEQLLTGSGDEATAYEISEGDVHPAASTDRSSGYARLGFGAQDTPNTPGLEFSPGVRFVQADWERKPKWFVCLQRGDLLHSPDLPPTATSGDRIVVYVPKYANREKTFWETQPSDLEEAWRSEAIPGRIFDVRIGDPKNERVTGILVLVADAQDKERHLTFYVPGSK